MTPRSLLKVVDHNEIELAPKLAKKYNFDAIPVIRRGAIAKYWDSQEGKALPITKRHRIPHDASVEEALPRLNEHLIQFVYYRSEVVGLVDLSDLNKPLGRLPWLFPMLECEQWILIKSLKKGFSDDQICTALGPRAANSARILRNRARTEDLVIPLLAFAHFSQILPAAVRLEIIAIEKSEINLLAKVRNRLVHAGRNLIEERKTDGKELLEALNICRRILAHA